MNKRTHIGHEQSPEYQNRLGVFYACGHCGETIDAALALKWYLTASCAGYADALWNAGSMLVDGERDIKADPALGLLLIRLAADVFQTSACLYLSRCYETGRFGLPPNPALARYWAKAAYQVENFKSFNHSAELDLIRRHPTVEQYTALPDRS